MNAYEVRLSNLHPRGTLLGIASLVLVSFLLTGCGGGGDPEAKSTAEMVLIKGGSLTIVGEQLPPRKPESLPEGEFEIATIVLSNAKLSDEELQMLGKLGSLRELNLYQSSITNEQLMHLTGLKSLRDLELSYTSITDEGVEHLKQLKQLRKLFLRGTVVSEAAATSLKSQLKKCDIYLGDTPLQ